MKRVGHKGADHVAPGNTVASFEAALEHGVDMIEFDVLRTRDKRLVLAHDWEDADGRDCLTLDDGLDHFEATLGRIDDLMKRLVTLVAPVEAIVERIDYMVGIGETVMSPLSFWLKRLVNWTKPPW